MFLFCLFVFKSCDWLLVQEQYHYMLELKPGKSSKVRRHLLQGLDEWKHVSKSEQPTINLCAQFMIFTFIDSFSMLPPPVPDCRGDCSPSQLSPGERWLRPPKVTSPAALVLSSCLQFFVLFQRNPNHVFQFTRSNVRILSRWQRA